MKQAKMGKEQALIFAAAISIDDVADYVKANRTAYKKWLAEEAEKDRLKKETPPKRSRKSRKGVAE